MTPPSVRLAGIFLVLVLHFSRFFFRCVCVSTVRVVAAAERFAFFCLLHIVSAVSVEYLGSFRRYRASIAPPYALVSNRFTTSSVCVRPLFFSFLFAVPLVSFRSFPAPHRQGRVNTRRKTRSNQSQLGRNPVKLGTTRLLPSWMAAGRSISAVVFVLERRENRPTDTHATTKQKKNGFRPERLTCTARCLNCVVGKPQPRSNH